jgi:DNA-binding HxlR family transcriptional regulator/putative sterol carrier protein
MTRGYGQYCGLARALELVGGRWSLLIVRELLTGPKRFTDLEQGLRGIPSNILSSRLRELEEAGLVERSLVPRSSSVVYRLTPYGQELEEPVVALGRWGARSLGTPDETFTFTASALMLALRGAFRPEKAKGRNLAVEIRLGDQRLDVLVSNEQVTFPSDPSSAHRLVLEMKPDVLAELLRGSSDLRSASTSGDVRVDGPMRDAARFFEMFKLPPGDGPPEEKPRQELDPPQGQGKSLGGGQPTSRAGARIWTTSGQRLR